MATRFHHTDGPRPDENANNEYWIVNYKEVKLYNNVGSVEQKPDHRSDCQSKSNKTRSRRSRSCFFWKWSSFLRASIKPVFTSFIIHKNLSKKCVPIKFHLHTVKPTSIQWATMHDYRENVGFTYGIRQVHIKYYTNSTLVRARILIN